MELNTLSLGDFVKLAKVIWVKSFRSVKNEMRTSGLVRVTSIPKNSGNTREFSEIDNNEYLSFKGEGDQAKRGKIQQGYTKTMTKYRVAENIGITFEMRDENKYPEVTQRIISGAKKGGNTMDLDLSHRITFGTATSYTDRDGRTIDISVGDTLSMFNTSHTVRGSSTTYRNRLAGNPQVSRGAIEGMEKLVVEETINQFGEKMMMDFDVLWTTDDPETINTVMEHLRSVAAPDASHAGVTNVYKAKYKHIVLPRVATDNLGQVNSTKRRYWGIASSMNSTLNMGVWEEPRLIAPVANGNAEDVQTDDWDFRVRAGYGIAAVNAAWIKFSSGDDSA